MKAATPFTLCGQATFFSLPSAAFWVTAPVALQVLGTWRASSWGPLCLKGTATKLNVGHFTSHLGFITEGISCREIACEYGLYRAHGQNRDPRDKEGVCYQVLGLQTCPPSPCPLWLASTHCHTYSKAVWAEARGLLDLQFSRSSLSTDRVESRDSPVVRPLELLSLAALKDGGNEDPSRDSVPCWRHSHICNEPPSAWPLALARGCQDGLALPLVWHPTESCFLPLIRSCQCLSSIWDSTPGMISCQPNSISIYYNPKVNMKAEMIDVWLSIMHRHAFLLFQNHPISVFTYKINPETIDEYNIQRIKYYLKWTCYK